MHLSWERKHIFVPLVDPLETSPSHVVFRNNNGFMAISDFPVQRTADEVGQIILRGEQYAGMEQLHEGRLSPSRDSWALPEGMVLVN